MRDVSTATGALVGAAGLPAASGSVLAFDYGEKRIGVAVGDTAIGIAHPLEQIGLVDNRRRLEAIERLVREWGPVRLVVGIPSVEGSADHPVAIRVRRFAQDLAKHFRLPVELTDERLTSWEASRKLTSAGLRARDQKAHVDALAACVILERWFEANRPKPKLMQSR